jgi:hypothetical protein
MVKRYQAQRASMASNVASGSPMARLEGDDWIIIKENGVWCRNTTKGLQNLLNRCHRAVDFEHAVQAAASPEQMQHLSSAHDRSDSCLLS